jgi:hypothetical protein
MRAAIGRVEPAFTEAAFRHQGRGDVVGTGRCHDAGRLPGGEADLDEWEAGFTDGVGRFYTRDEAAQALGVHGPLRSERRRELRGPPGA